MGAQLKKTAISQECGDFFCAMYVMKHLFKKNREKICSCRIFFVTLQPNREKPIESML